MTSKIKANWRKTTLGQLCERIDYGFTASADFSTKEPRFLRITDIQNGRVEWESVPGCKISGTETEQNRLCDGDIVFARTGATTGKSFLIKSPPNAVFASYLIRMRLKQECDPEFFSLFLQGEDYWRQIRSQARGGAQPNFNASMLSALQVKLPDLPEQRRIAARLREQMAEMERARAAVQAQLDAAQSLPAALLRAIFTSPAAQRWPHQPFGSLVENFDGVRIPLKHTDRNNRKGGYPYFGASGIIDQIDDFLFDGEFLLIGEDGANLLNRSTPIAFRAKGKFWVNNHAHVVQPKSGIRIEWLEHFFAATDLKPFVTGSAQPKLSQGSLNEIPVPVPAPDEQNNLVARLDAELTAARSLVETLETRLAEIELLPAALLRTAFRGGNGLVPA